MKFVVNVWLLTGFLILGIVTTQAQQKSVRDLPTFTGIAFRTAGKVYLRQGKPQRVEISGPADVINKIETRVDDNRLIIQREGRWSDWNFRDSDEDKITVYITVEQIDYLGVSGSGSLIGQTPIATRDLELKVSGSGDLEIEAYPTGLLETSVSGSGNLKVSGRAERMESQVSGSGRIEGDLKVTGDVDLGISGSGRYVLSGSAGTIRISISGSGRVMAAQMEAANADIRISGSGDAEIWVNKSIESRISGSGSIRYKGNPARVNNNSSGSGSISRI